MRKGRLPGKGTALVAPLPKQSPTLQALQAAAGAASGCSLVSEDRTSLEVEAWTGPSHLGETSHVKPAELVTLKQAKANRRLPALVH